MSPPLLPRRKWIKGQNILLLFSFSFGNQSVHAVTNACTLVPTVFRWHKKMAFKFHFYFSFFFGLVKWNSIPISIFRFLSTCDDWKTDLNFVFAALWKGDLNFGFCFSFSHHFEKRIWISFFVFRFRITLKNGFEFRFSYLHCLLLKNRLEFLLSFLHEFEKWINTPVIWNSPSRSVGHSSI